MKRRRLIDIYAEVNGITAEWLTDMWGFMFERENERRRGVGKGHCESCGVKHDHLPDCLLFRVLCSPYAVDGWYRAVELSALVTPDGQHDAGLFRYHCQGVDTPPWLLPNLRTQYLERRRRARRRRAGR